jgi:serpin B
MQIKKIFSAALSIVFLFSSGSFAQNVVYEDYYKTAHASNSSAIEFYKVIDEHNEEANIYFSPHALYAACAILFEGASDKTYEEFLSVFYFPDDLVKRREIFSNWLKPKANAAVKNSFWLSAEFDYLDAYKLVLEKYYFAEFNAKTDFTKASAAVKISKKIEQGSPGSLPEDIFDKNTQAVLVNTAGFYAKWKDSFDKKTSVTDDFYMPKGKKAKTKFLRREGRHLYYEDKRIQILKLEFDKPSVSALLIMSKQNQLHYARQFLYRNTVKGILDNLSWQKTVVYIPEFTFYGLYDFADVISALGVKDPQYVKISPDNPLVSNFFHGVSIKIGYEFNTSETKVIDVGGAGTKRIERDLPPYVFRADHPFIFMIIDEYDAKIMFLGKVSNPEE